MFGLLSAPSQADGMYIATFQQEDDQTCIRIERILAGSKNMTPVHIIRPTDCYDLLCLENQMFQTNEETNHLELVHSHTEAFRRYM